MEKLIQDYTNTQTKSIKQLKGAAHPISSEKTSELAEMKYRETFGPRDKFTHIKATDSLGGPFHFSLEYMRYIIKYPKDITVFYIKDNPAGWLYHYEVQDNWTDCPIEGRDLGIGVIRPMKDYSPVNKIK